MVVRPRRLLLHLSGHALRTALMVLTILLFITVTLILAELLADVSDGELLPSSLLSMLLLRMPEALLLSAPLALVLGVLMSFGERAELREFDAMRAAGTSPALVFAGVAAPAVLWAGLLLLVSGWLQPWALSRSAEVTSRMADELLVSSVRPGQFQRLAGGRVTMHAMERGSGSGLLSEVFVQIREDDRIEVMTARSGRVETDATTGQSFLVLEDGRHLGHPDRQMRPYRVVDFKRNRIALPVPAGPAFSDRMATRSLHRLTGASDLDVQLEWQRRAAPVLATILLSFLALPASLASARGHRWGAAVPAVLVYLLYSNGVLLLVNQAGAGGLATGWIWGMHAAMLLIVLVCILLWWRRW